MFQGESFPNVALPAPGTHCTCGEAVLCPLGALHFPITEKRDRPVLLLPKIMVPMKWDVTWTGRIVRMRAHVGQHREALGHWLVDFVPGSGTQTALASSPSRP